MYPHPPRKGPCFLGKAADLTLNLLYHLHLSSTCTRPPTSAPTQSQWCPPGVSVGFPPPQPILTVYSPAYGVVQIRLSSRRAVQATKGWSSALVSQPRWGCRCDTGLGGGGRGRKMAPPRTQASPSRARVRFRRAQRGPLVSGHRGHLKT